MAECTRFGWSLMSPGENGKETLGCLAVNSTSDYDNLCALDILGLADNMLEPTAMSSTNSKSS